jgi:hypothetical protein
MNFYARSIVGVAGMMLVFLHPALGANGFATHPVSVDAEQPPFRLVWLNEATRSERYAIKFQHNARKLRELRQSARRDPLLMKRLAALGMTDRNIVGSVDPMFGKMVYYVQ